MTKAKDNISAVPTNIVTGFLGAGKTSTISHLLKSKPDNERWAVLVNEFGEIGIDGSLLHGQHKEDKGIYIKEVPGGCMCCVAGLPMQVALNKLLITAKPDRLLIEPTGLGHPVEVLEALSANAYQDILTIQKILTLLDARKLNDPRYINHQTFNQQIDIADVIVANKQDLYFPGHRRLLEQYIQSKYMDEVELVYTQQGEILLELLDGLTTFPLNNRADEHHKESTIDIEHKRIAFPTTDFIKFENEGEGFKSVGWRFEAEKKFMRSSILSFLSSIAAERVKAVFITETGIYGYNLSSDGLTETMLEDCKESCIGIIASHIEDEWQERLFACLQ